MHLILDFIQISFEERWVDNILLFRLIQSFLSNATVDLAWEPITLSQMDMLISWDLRALTGVIQPVIFYFGSVFLVKEFSI